MVARLTSTSRSTMLEANQEGAGSTPAWGFSFFETPSPPFLPFFLPFFLPLFLPFFSAVPKLCYTNKIGYLLTILYV